jgi:hypothetical protein
MRDQKAAHGLHEDAASRSYPRVSLHHASTAGWLTGASSAPEHVGGTGGALIWVFEVDFIRNAQNDQRLDFAGRPQWLSDAQG